MKSTAKKIIASAVSAAAIVGATQSASAALQLSFNRTSNVSFKNGTYDVIDVTVTGLTGLDGTSGSGGPGIVLDPEVLGLSGTFTATGTGVTLATPGAATGTYQAGKYDNATGAPQVSGTPLNYGASYVDFPSNVAFVGTGTTGGSGSKTAIAGTSTAFGDSWYVVPTTTASGNAGGVEPGQDPNGTGINGLLAEILVTPGGNFSFTGTYSDYGYTAGNAITFSSGGTSTTPPPTHSIISLTSSAPTGYGNALPTLTMTHVSGAVVPNSETVTATNMAFVPVSGFLSTDIPETFALKLLVSGAAPTSTQLNTIIADINSASQTTGVTAELLPGSLASAFPGYSIALVSNTPDTTPNLGFDFTAETNVAGVTVVGVAAVPEPATAMGLLVGAGSLLLGRRKNRAA